MPSIQLERGRRLSILFHCRSTSRVSTCRLDHHHRKPVPAVGMAKERCWEHSRKAVNQQSCWNQRTVPRSLTSIVSRRRKVRLGHVIVEVSPILSHAVIHEFQAEVRAAISEDAEDEIPFRSTACRQQVFWTCPPGCFEYFENSLVTALDSLGR